MTYRKCRKCLKEGYDKCLCRFCRTCGQTGHKVKDCKAILCSKCKSWHLGDKCLLDQNEADLFHSDVYELSDMSDNYYTDSDSSLPPASTTFLPGSIERGPKIKETSVRRFISQQSHNTSIRSKNLGLVDRSLILSNLLAKIRSGHSERYRTLFELGQHGDIPKILETNLNPNVRAICENGEFTLESLKLIGQDPGYCEKSGVYLHILWKRCESENFWLYIGQAAKLCDRIKSHKNPYHRHRNPSLHYHVWDSAPDLESVFVTLATCPAPTCLQEQLLLNIQEMWMALVFQTLTSLHLEEYLPGGTDILWSGHHLNVALPLWQGFTGTNDHGLIQGATGGRTAFQEFLFSKDPNIREWAKDARAAFNDIRNSPDPNLRKYYQDLQLKRRLRSQKTWEQKKFDNMRQYLSGVEKTVSTSKNSFLHVVCGSFQVVILKSLWSKFNIQSGNRVLVQFHLNQTPCPNAYAQRAWVGDPARRLAISIRSLDPLKDFHIWLVTRGLQSVMKINTHVDILEGYSLEESRAFKRRWHVIRQVPCDSSSRQTREAVYT